VIKHAHNVTRSLHWPLRRLALCLDCDECFELGLRACPACSSETWTTLSRFLEIAPLERIARSAVRAADRPTRRPREEQQHIARHLLVVARDHMLLYEHLRRTLAKDQSVQVLLDRRSRERRQEKGQRAVSRRLSDRRARPSLESEQLRAIGWSLVLLDLQTGHASSDTHSETPKGRRR
jgi:hypothetical protein